MKGADMFIEWNESLAIGVEEIDEEHKGIIIKFEELYQKMRQGKGHEMYLEIIDFLEDYINTHLEHEEAYQQKINYPDFDAHKAKHDEFRKIVHEIKEETHEEISHKDLIEVNQLMKNWLINHIMEVDAKIGEFVKENEN